MKTKTKYAMIAEVSGECIRLHPAIVAEISTFGTHINTEASELAGRYKERRVMAKQFIEAYRRYC